MNDDVMTRNSDGELAVRVVSATEQATVVNPNDVYTRDTDGNLAVRTVGNGGGGSDPHNLGWYATQSALETAHPTADDGDWAIVGATDTVWVWDSDTNAWKDTDQKGQVTSVNGQTGAVTVQETLVNQSNIKSVNGNSLLGSGNLELSTYLPYPAGWTTTGTTKAFCDDIAADTTAIGGKAYLGEVTLSDLPASMGNAEIVVEIMAGTTAQNKVIVLTCTSGNTAPYMWKYTYWNNGTDVSGWKGFQEQLESGTNIKTINGQSVLGSGDLTISGSGLPQYSTMPTASVSNVGEIAQYTGADEPDTPASATVTQTTGNDLTDITIDVSTFEAEEQPTGAETVTFVFVNRQGSVEFDSGASLQMACSYDDFTSYVGAFFGSELPSNGYFWTNDDSGTIYCGGSVGDPWFDTTVAEMEEAGFTISGIDPNAQSSTSYHYVAEDTNWYKEGTQQVPISWYGISYTISGGASYPANGDVLTVNYTPVTAGYLKHSFIYESKPDYSDASATISQTVGAGLYDLSVDVATFEAEEQPTGDETAVFVASLGNNYVIEPTTYDSEVYLSITDTNKFVAKAQEYLTSQSLSTDFDYISIYVNASGGTVLASSIEFQSQGSTLTIINISFQEYEDWGIYFDGRGGTVDSWILSSTVGRNVTWTKSGTEVNPTDYGIVYYGQPADNDEITVVYTASAVSGYHWEQTNVQPAGGSSSGIDWKTKVDLPSDVRPYDGTVGAYFTIAGGLPTGEYEMYFEVKTANTQAALPYGVMTSKIKFSINNDYNTCNGFITPVLDGRTVPTANRRFYNQEKQANPFLYKNGSDLVFYADMYTLDQIFSTDIHGYQGGASVSECFKLSAIKNIGTGEEYIATGDVFVDQYLGDSMSGILYAYPIFPPIELPVFYHETTISGINIGLSINGIELNTDTRRLKFGTELDIFITLGNDRFDAIIKDTSAGYEIKVPRAEGVFANTQVGVQRGGYLGINFNFPAGTTGTGKAVTAFIGASNVSMGASVIDYWSIGFTPLNILKIGETPVVENYLGKILQYTGTTDANYTNGYFYKASGSLITVPASVDCIEPSGDITVTMDVDNFISTVATYLGWSEETIINSLNAGYEFNYNADDGILYWGAYGQFDSTITTQLMQYVTFSPAVSSGYVSWTTGNYMSAHKEIQNGAWVLVDVQSATTLLKSVTGYDATKTQILKNVSGTFTWVDE